MAAATDWKSTQFPRTVWGLLGTHLSEFEDCERWSAVVGVDAPQNRVDLRVVAGVSKSQQEGAHEGQNRVAGDIGAVWSVFEWRTVGQIHEDDGKAHDMHQKACDHYGVATPFVGFGAQYTKRRAPCMREMLFGDSLKVGFYWLTQHLAHSNEDPR